VIRTLFLVSALGLATSSVSAMPLMRPAAAIGADNIVNVKVVCEPDGRCYQRGRRPVARWVYGEGAFSGPVGPGYYGRPSQYWNSRLFWIW
jgi:hypothetical protein